MKFIVGIARIIVGVIFMISGFIKLNDPIGFSYKLEEYFGPQVFGLEFLQPFALAIAVFIVVLELLLGFMLLVGYARNFTRWTLLLMIIFFTFLTFYSAAFNKVTDCGCFGDALKLTPWQSFWKDIGLLVLTLLIFFNRRYIRPIFYGPSLKYLVFIVFIGSLGFGYYVLMHLPVMDFRAYSVGTDIEEAMQPKKGQLIPPIHDFGFFGKNGNHTKEILNTDQVMVVLAYNVGISQESGWPEIKDAVDKAKANRVKVVGLTATLGEKLNKIKDKYNFEFPFYFTDATAIKTIVRSNPGIMLIENGVIKQKLHWNDTEELKIE